MRGVFFIVKALSAAVTVIAEVGVAETGLGLGASLGDVSDITPWLHPQGVLDWAEEDAGVYTLPDDGGGPGVEQARLARLAVALLGGGR